jgi:hypothetical protein
MASRVWQQRALIELLQRGKASEQWRVRRRQAEKPLDAKLEQLRKVFDREVPQS